MNTKLNCVRAGLPAFALIFAIALPPLEVRATPYASALANNGGAISFRLNEAADDVKIVFIESGVTNSLGALPAGYQSFVFADPGAFKVVVSKSSPVGFVTPIAPNRGAVQQISTDGPAVRFNQPRGIAVNTDPASRYFGRIYVANAASGSITNTAFPGTRTLGDGIYMLNPDFSDAVGQGDTARTATLDFATGGSASPYRLTIGQDSRLYIADWSDTTGTLLTSDPDVSEDTGGNVLGGPVGGPFPVTTARFHGSIAAAVIEGTLAGGNLAVYVIDEDLQTDRAATAATMRNSLWRHDIGGSLPGPAVMPTRITATAPWVRSSSQTMGLVRATNGSFYATDYRSAGTESGLFVLDTNGVALWNSLAATRSLLSSNTAPDFLRGSGGVALSPNTPHVAVINLETNGITILPLEGGLPDIANRLVIDFGFAGPQGRDLAFDAAGNLYALSQGAQLLRVFSPGGSTVATTGSDGTFVLVRPPGVSVEASDAVAGEAGPDTGTFNIYRTGPTNAALTVYYTLTGTASNGVDYATNTLSATIPAGATHVTVVITPIDDAIAELPETVTLTLQSTGEYDAKTPATATIGIADNEYPNVATVTPQVGDLSERFPSRPGSVLVTRYGSTNNGMTLVYSLSGTATSGLDYAPPAFDITLAPGETTKLVTISALDDSDYEGDETIIFTLEGGLDYDPGIPASATLRLHDDEWAPAATVFADDFEANSAADWTVRFGANNGIYDATTTFAYDYVAAGIPLAPHSAPGTGKGLFVTVNKSDATAGGSAGVNLYPNGRIFSGDYTLRFDMFLSFGTAGTTEHAIAGLNHSGFQTNRVTQSTDTNNTTRGGDGIWVAIETDASANRDYSAYTTTSPETPPALIASRSASAMIPFVPSPPYTFAGSPGNGPGSTKTWASVELSQAGNLITLKVNDGLVFTVTNTTAFTSGNIMLGHNDQFDSVGSAANYVIFDNVQVFVNPSVAISSIRVLSGNQVQIDFTSADGAAGDFHLQSTGSLGTPFADDNGATISTIPGGFRAVTTQGGAARYYRIRR